MGCLVSLGYHALVGGPSILEITIPFQIVNIHGIIFIATLQPKFVIFQPLSYCFEKKKIEFDVTVSLANRPMSRLFRWYNKLDDITKEFWEKPVQFHGTFYGLKITNWPAVT